MAATYKETLDATQAEYSKITTGRSIVLGIWEYSLLDGHYKFHESHENPAYLLGYFFIIFAIIFQKK